MRKEGLRLNRQDWSGDLAAGLNDHAAPLHNCKYRWLQAPATKDTCKEGRRIPATSSFVRWPPTCRQIPPQLDLKRLAALVWREHDGVHAAAKGLARFWTAFWLLKCSGELGDLRAVDVRRATD
jgi:hypothetical protein